MTRVIALAFIVFTPFNLITGAPASAQETKIAQTAGPVTDSLTQVLKGRVPSGIQLLDDLTVAKPSPEVPPQLAEFSGVWSGKLYSAKSGTLQAEFVYVFEKVAPDSVTIVSMGIGRDMGSRAGGGGNVGTVWTTRYETLKPTYTFELLSGGKLKVSTLGAGSSVSWIGTFEKVTL